MERRAAIIVTVTDEALSSIDELRGELASLGMDVEQVMPITGAIAGTAPAAKLEALKRVRGVLSVEPELSAELPPRGSQPQ